MKTVKVSAMALEDLLSAIIHDKYKFNEYFNSMKKDKLIGSYNPILTLLREYDLAVNKSIKEEYQSSNLQYQNTKDECNKCDDFGGELTVENQVSIPVNGRVVCVDWCIHSIVSALNASGIETVASCCGHGKIDGRIDLKDGRSLIIKKTEI